jgi:peptidoglycan/xylan/chitin deacetylase (PgdA/CDA1 family)/GT2 family glycosyltransferase
VNQTYQSLPTPFVVQRTGARDKLVSLTFDDGPDPTWTPKILAILDKYHVPATFFIVGENGVANRGLLQRMVADGHEIGNHSYTHPNMAEEAETGIKLELNATQRLIEAFTGRSTRLFRAPYFGDAEPTTADELGPALIAQEQGYTVVGLHVDPGDWKRPGVDAIVERTLAGVAEATPDRSTNIVLLHDGGGDRAQTVAALPRIIEGLEKAGYRIVPTATLAGLDRDAVMPRVQGVDLAAVRADVAAFTVIGAVLTALDWTFFFAIALGMIRSVGLALLALRRRREAPAPVSAEKPLVTVIIPAYNEERVIEGSIRRILASDYPEIEVIVADDGSRDRTSAIVAAEFAEDPRVRLLTLANGGKASALNRALTHASGSVIVALDADTQFEPETVSRLVRWFADERIGAVAGNAKVGNRVNLVTRWQAVEYVTAQNLERRALTRFDAIMVVPGAVGAWRREALDDVGGYPEDTLAEDQDLTIAIQRKGWKIAYDEDAVAWTEAPETLRALAKQRFRWSFGTLQCLWKHRAVLWTRRPSALAFIGMPQAWLFQIAFAVVSPAIDLALLISIAGTALRVSQHGWAQTQTDVLRMAAYWLAFTAVDLACGWVAYRLDTREKRYPALLLLAQRVVYRQLMYGVVIRAVDAALAGLGIGWGKLERTGRVDAIPAASPPAGQPQGRDEPLRVAGTVIA